MYYYGYSTHPICLPAHCSDFNGGVCICAGPHFDKTVLYGALETGRAGNLHINPLLITLIILISLLAFIDIFLYKNLQRQMTVCFVDIIIGLAMLVAIGIQAFVVGNREGWTVSWQWYVLLPVLSIIFLMMAHKAMSRDKKKLLDADRLR